MVGPRTVRWIILTGLFAFAACRNTPPEPSTRVEPEAVNRPTRPTVVLHTQHGDLNVEVEVARTPAVRNRGLMYRREMAEDHGMIFMFPQPDHQVFWMHNTILPLDMVFIRADRTILGIVQNARPETDDQREVPGDSQFVLELNGGYANRHHLAAGDRVEFLNIQSAVE